MKKLLTILLIILGSLPTFAQEGLVTGRVRNLITENGVDSAVVTILTADSARVGASYAVIKYSKTEIDGKKVWGPNAKNGALFSLKVPKPGRYILRCMSGGYQTTFFPIDVKYSATKTTFDAGDLYIQEISTQIAEAVVTGTKIRMFYKGDTLVYNASAFQLPDGSMLDDLVKQLPGAELRDGGIYVNGRLIENLLLGGKDFFNGNPKAALANLPAYVVNSVKVYEKQGEKSQTTGTSMGDEQYIMDVRLKRKYIGTYLGRLIAGYGTENRYQAGLFLMRFDDRQSFSLSGDFNNRNLSYEFSRRGQRSTSEPGGKRRRNYVDANYQYEPHGRLRFTAGANYQDLTSWADGGSSNEYYLAGGNTFGRTETSSRTHNMNVGGRTKLTLRPAQGQFYELNYSIDYRKRDGRSHLRTANYAAEPPEMDFYALLDSTFNLASTDVNLQSLILSRLQQQSLSDGKEMQHQASAKMHRAFSGNLLNLEADFTANNRDNHLYDLYDLKYSHAANATDFRHRYQSSNNDDTHYGLKATYDWKYRQTERLDGQLSPYYQFSFDRNNQDNPLYRLDSLGGAWADFDPSQLGTLPSTREALNEVLSNTDSYRSELRTMKHLLGLSWRHEMLLKNKRWLKLFATAEVTLQDGDYDYRRYKKDFHAERTSWLPSPSFKINYLPLANDRRGTGSKWELGFSAHQQFVDLHHIINVTDASDPLFVRLGNSALENPWLHHGWLSYSRRIQKVNGNFFNSLDLYLHENEVAISSVYNRQTGVRTIRPVNIDGNWSARYFMHLNMSLDKQQRWFLMPIATISYQRNVDLSWTSEQEASLESEVKSLNVAGGFMLNARPAKWLNLSANMKAEWNHIAGSRPEFETIRATTLSYGLQSTFTLPAKFIFHVNVAATTRYGYADPSLNDTRATINASLERSIKDFTLKFEGCDLLARNRYTTSVLNAQGRTETFATCLPRYVMLSVAWKFNKVANRK